MGRLFLQLNWSSHNHFIFLRRTAAPVLAILLYISSKIRQNFHYILSTLFIFLKNSWTSWKALTKYKSLYIFSKPIANFVFNLHSNGSPTKKAKRKATTEQDLDEMKAKIEDERKKLKDVKNMAEEEKNKIKHELKRQEDELAKAQLEHDR